MNTVGFSQRYARKIKYTIKYLNPNPNQKFKQKKSEGCRLSKNSAFQISLSLFLVFIIQIYYKTNRGPKIQQSVPYKKSKEY